MTKRGILGLLIAFVAVVVLTFFVWKPRDNTKIIAFIVPTLGNPFFVDMAEAAKAAMKGLPDYRLTVQAPAEFTNVEQQISMIENEITLKVAAICLVASDSKGVVPALKKAQDADIPVLLIDNTVDLTVAKAADLKLPSHIGSNNLLGGKLAAEYIGRALNGTGQVAMLEGVLGSDVANARKQGFLDGLKEFPGIRLVASQTANYVREQAVDVFQAILQANPSLDALFAANDEMALGAIKVIAGAHPQKKILVVGFDATADGLAAVKNGSMAATIQQQPKEMGRIAIEQAGKLIGGQPIAPETLVEVKLVTGANQ